MQSLLLFERIELVYCAISFVLTLGLIISTSEDLVNWKIYQEDGLLSWKVSKHRSFSLLKHPIFNRMTWILSDQVFHYILILSLILSAAFLFFVINGIFNPLIITSLLISRILILMRSSYGLDGAFQMNIIVLLALTIASISGIHSQVAEVCLWFLAGELIVAYFIAGIVKIGSPIWRKSYALNGIFSTRMYGHDVIYRLITKYRYIPLILCWSTLVFELGFPLSLLSHEMCIIFCLAGISFHLFNAVFMGLNTFLFSFLSTYPAFIFCMLKMQ